MSGEIETKSGYVFDVAGNESIDLSKLNRIVADAVLRIFAGSVTAREIADGSITADKLDAEIAAQLGIPDGSITTAKLVDLAVTTVKLAAEAVTTDKIADDAVTRAKLERTIGFYAYLGSNMAVVNDVPKRIAIDTELYDFGAYFDAATESRFTPITAEQRVYLVGAHATIEGIDNAGQMWIRLYKNGALYAEGVSPHVEVSSPTNQVSGTIVVPVVLDGATDYVEAWVEATNSQNVIGTQDKTYFWAQEVNKLV